MTHEELGKSCPLCGTHFIKRVRESADQWEARKYCSTSCSARSRTIVPLHVRFWQKVEKRGGNKCWIWTGARDNHGYGKIGVGGGPNRVNLKAHRLSYEMRFGLIQGQNVICHTCDNPSCVNPNHLFEGSQKDNVKDAVRKGRLNPASLNNLRPGSPGHHGAGPLSNKEINNVR